MSELERQHKAHVARLMRYPPSRSWKRHADGAPFDGVGIGRLWPLLTGERAHYELAAGRPEEAKRLLAAFEASASPGGLLPEQIWDSEDIPQRELFLGRPSGVRCPWSGLTLNTSNC